MRHVIVYDISSNKLRSRVARELEGWGKRVQKSVFECHFQGPEVPRLVKTLERMLEGAEGDSIRIYPLCERCWGQALGIGTFRAEGDDPCTILD